MRSSIPPSLEIQATVSRGHAGDAPEPRNQGMIGREDRRHTTIIGNEVTLTARLRSDAERGGILMANESHSLLKD